MVSAGYFVSSGGMVKFSYKKDLAALASVDMYASACSSKLLRYLTLL